MTVEQRSIVVGVFAEQERAERAVRELLAAGFPQERIGFLTRDSEANNGLGAIVGGYTGAAAGGLLGGLLGTAISAVIPGVGPIVGAGLVGMMLAGAYVGGIAGVLIGLGVPEGDARRYHQEVEAGRSLVTVRADGRYSEALAILAAAGALDVLREAQTPAEA
jgi:hypothetical protein